MKRIPFKVLSDGNTLLGVIDIPDNYNKEQKKELKICIFCNGLNGNRIENNRIFVELALKLAINGVVCVRFDYMGMGVSEGDFWNVSIGTKVQNLKDIFNYISFLFEDKKKKWFLLGYSDGITVVLNYLKDSKDNDYNIVAWSPILINGEEKGGEMKGANRKLVRDNYSKKIVMPFGGLWLGIDYIRDIKANNNMLYEYIKNKNRALAIFGSNDEKTKLTRNELKKDNYFKIVVIENANHVFSDRKSIDLVLKNTIEWINNH